LKAPQGNVKMEFQTSFKRENMYEGKREKWGNVEEK
jgi:hypothetical protein